MLCEHAIYLTGKPLKGLKVKGEYFGKIVFFVQFGKSLSKIRDYLAQP